jgi:hypothetical protein
MANRANAQRSTGPKTEAGKSRTRLNGFRHGLTGQVCIFTPEDQAAFEAHCAGIREALSPAGPLELEIAQSIAEDRWRLKRARALENGIFALGYGANPAGPDEDSANHPEIDASLDQARTWLAGCRSLQLLTLYEQRIYRSVEKNTAQLKTLQAARRAARQIALEEAQLLAQLAYMRGQQYDPANDFPPANSEIGSGFSTAAINHRIARDQRLDEAKFYASCLWDRNARYPGQAVRIPVLSAGPKISII